MWRIENLELAEVNPRTYGQFYGGDCYLLLYTYRVSSREQRILYMWQVGSARLGSPLRWPVYSKSDFGAARGVTPPKTR